MTTIILAGGRSSRMGENKAVKPFMGKPLIQWLVERFRPHSLEVVVVSSEADPYSHFGVRVVGDVFPGRGPLAGLHAGLIASSSEVNAVLACDLPFASPFLIGHMAQYTKQARAVIPRASGRLQPLHGVYRADCLPFVEKLLAAGGSRMEELLAEIGAHIVGEEEVALFEDPERVFINVNTPGEFEKALEAWCKSSYCEARSKRFRSKAPRSEE